VTPEEIAERSRLANYQLGRENLRRLGRRAESMLMTARMLGRQPRPCVVEAGTVRQPGNWDGDGQSTVLWGSLVARYRPEGRIYSFDPDRDAIEAARRALDSAGVGHRTFLDARAAYEAFVRRDAGDAGFPWAVALVMTEAEGPHGIDRLHDAGEPVNLAYLDAGDQAYNGSLDGAARINDAALEAALPCLRAEAGDAWVLMDDVGGWSGGGKGRYAMERLALEGWHLLRLPSGHDYQRIATRDCPTSEERKEADGWGSN
jgi:hypothetical protein